MGDSRHGRGQLTWPALRPTPVNGAFPNIRPNSSTRGEPENCADSSEDVGVAGHKLRGCETPMKGCVLFLVWTSRWWSEAKMTPALLFMLHSAAERRKNRGKILTSGSVVACAMVVKILKDNNSFLLSLVLGEEWKPSVTHRWIRKNVRLRHLSCSHLWPIWQISGVPK